MEREKRLIDAKAAISKLEDEILMCAPVSEGDGYLEAYKKRVIPKLVRDVINWLQVQPTVDAVPVVRCKDCKRYDPGYIRPDHGWCEEWDTCVRGTGFCHHGERRPAPKKTPAPNDWEDKTESGLLEE